MLRLIIFLIAVAAVATGLSWLADRPGDIAITWQGYRKDTSVFQVAVAFVSAIVFALVAWSLLRHLWESPAVIGRLFQRRRQTRGLDALSSGMIAIGAGDRDSAARYALQARKALPNEPLTHLLRAQAAQLTGDKATSRRIFEAMLGAPDTEQLGLRGLYLEAQREGEEEAATQFAERALKINPKLEWAATSLFELQCKRGDWKGAIETLSIAKRHGEIEKQSADRRRAVLLTAQAQEAEDGNQDLALNLALEAHGLAPDLIPASAIAGRLLASRGNTPRASKILQKTWKKSPHPDLAVAFAYARLGDSPRDRLERVQKLAALNPHSIESPIAVATAAIEAKDFHAARRALEPLLDGRMTQRVCTLMAVIESEAHGNKGRVREWLARAVNAPRDPAWTADGIVSESWAPTSPVSGALDAFAWRVPVEAADPTTQEIIASKLEALIELGAGADLVDDVVRVTAEPVATQRSDDSSATHDGAGNVSTPIPSRPTPKGEDNDTDDIDVASPESIASMALSRPMDADIDDDVALSHVRIADVKITPTHAKTRDTSGSTPSKSASKSTKSPAGVSSSREVPNSSVEDVEIAPEKAPKKPRRATKKRAVSKGSRKSEPRIFVSPRAPDDPGPGSATDAGDRRPPANPYRRSPRS